MSDAKIELLVLIADLTTSETPANRDLSRKSIGGEVKRLTDNLVKENDSLRTRLAEQEARIAEAEAVLELFETAIVNKGDVYMYSDEEEARDALTAYRKKYGETK